MPSHKSQGAARRSFTKASNLEAKYLRQLRQVVRQIDAIIKGMASQSVEDPTTLTQSLNRYSELLLPWARAVGQKMVSEVALRDAKAWNSMGRLMGRTLRKEIDAAPTGEMMRAMMEEQVGLITSLPREAAQRVHKVTIQGISQGLRVNDILQDILQTGSVTMSRARCIARTEIARTTSKLTQARSEHIGATHYVWRTAGDSDVRDSHKKMEGQVIEWANPPTLSDGTVTHAGQIYNCRCYPEPIIPEE